MVNSHLLPHNWTVSCAIDFYLSGRLELMTLVWSLLVKIEDSLDRARHAILIKQWLFTFNSYTSLGSLSLLELPSRAYSNLLLAGEELDLIVVCMLKALGLWRLVLPIVGKVTVAWRALALLFISALSNWWRSGRGDLTLRQHNIVIREGN